jgi:hypothetical protein
VEQVQVVVQTQVDQVEQVRQDTTSQRQVIH